jgi:hypothetical protein
MPRPRTNAKISILNSILNFAGRKSLTQQCVNCQFYITLFNHLCETTVGICRPGWDSVGTFSIRSIPPRLYRHCCAAKQHKKNPKVGHPILVHDPNPDRLRLAMASQKLQHCIKSPKSADNSAPPAARKILGIFSEVETRESHELTRME